MKRPSGKIVSVDKATLLDLVGYKAYTDEVVRFHNSNARVKIASAPARTSKSYSGAFDALVDCFPRILHTDDGHAYPMEDKRIWIVCPNFSLAKEFEYLYDTLIRRRKELGFGYVVQSQQFNPDSGHMKIILSWGQDWKGVERKTFIEVKSAANMQSIQADQADVVICSEAAELDEIVWSKYVSTRFGRAIIPTTPKISGEWTRKLIEEGKENPQLRTESFDYDGRCNPEYDWERYWMEHWRAESRVSCPIPLRINLEAVNLDQPPSASNGHDCFGKYVNCWAEKDASFAEQYMGRWTMAAERVLPFRHYDPESGQVSHIIDELPYWVGDSEHYVSVDYGFTDPAAALWFAVGPDGTVVLYDEIYESGLTAFELSNRIKERSKDRKIRFYIGDPRKPEVASHFQRLGLPMPPYINKNRQADRQAGHMTFVDYLTDDPLTGRPKFYVHKSCTASIDEFRLLRRKPTSSKEYSETAYEGLDHAYDATRYFLTVNPKGKTEKQLVDKEIERQIQINRKLWRSARPVQPAWPGVVA